jgi:hypothetical protein
VKEIWIEEGMILMDKPERPVKALGEIVIRVKNLQAMHWA